MTWNEDGILGLDNQFCFALYAANRAVISRYRPLLTGLGLTYPQYLVMLVLWEAHQERQEVRVSGLGQRLRLDSGTLTPLLKRLSERGLVRRERSSDDERVVTLVLTGEGVALREQARGIPGRLLCGIDVEPEHILALRNELRGLLTALEAAGPSD